MLAKSTPELNNFTQKELVEITLYQLSWIIFPKGVARRLIFDGQIIVRVRLDFRLIWEVNVQTITIKANVN